ncbi:hypothetical protein D9615_004726 [Tricholomella constricta]|uniref:CCHC-type domain-containing protein n=1 Tax=Tricholomella constricta TaxID=117010 RepID=A0A8H5HBW5_9AGAR|nr:hypothetical protein D9615_004726 [Tricholomella constricta]
MSFNKPAPKAPPTTRSKAVQPNAKSTPKQTTLDGALRTTAKHGQSAMTLRTTKWSDRQDEEESENEEDVLGNDAELSEGHLRSLGLIRPHERLTVMVLSRILNVVANYAGIVDHSGRDIILACAQLVATLEPTDIAEAVSREVATQVHRSSNEIKALLETTRRELKEDIVKATARATEQAQQANEVIQESARTMERTVTSYRDALTSKGSDSQTPFATIGTIDPKTRAREAVRIRQVLIDFSGTGTSDIDDFKDASPAQLVSKANTAIKKIDPRSKHEICAVKRLNNGEILMEANDETAATWVKDNADQFTEALGHGATIQRRTFNMIARFVSVDFDPTSAIQHMALTERNRIPQESIASIRWIKPIERHSPGQRTAHLLIKLYDQRAANDLAVRGLYILGERISVEKDRKEPIRCYKCHDWDHVAATCVKSRSFCGRCGDTEHATTDCTSHELYCLPCGRKGHVSGDRRHCPTFKAKRDEMNARMPENSMPYFPTEEPWTHSVVSRPRPPRTVNYVPQINVHQPSSQRQRKQAGRDIPPSWEVSLAPSEGRLSPAPTSYSRENSLAPPATGPNATQRTDKAPMVEPHYRGSVPPGSQ